MDVPELQLVRGFVTKISCELVFRIRFDGSRWNFEGDQPGTCVHAKPYPFPLSELQQLKNLPANAPKDTVIGIRVRGAFNRSGDQLVPTDRISLAVEAPIVPPVNVTAFNIEWHLTLQSTKSSQATEVVYEDEGDKWPEQLANSSRFVHPLDLVDSIASNRESLVEIVGTQGPSVVIGRFWPQRPLGYVLDAKLPDYPARLCFADGDEVTVASRMNGPTGSPTATTRFDVTRAAGSGPQGQVTITSISPERSLLIAGTVTAMTLVSSALRIELTDLHGKVWVVEHTIAKSSPAMIQPAITALPPRRLTEVELGEFLMAECDLNVVQGAAVRPRVVRIQSNDGGASTVQSLRASLSLLGRRAQAPESLSAPGQTKEGTDRYQMVQIDTVVRELSTQPQSGSEGQIKLWARRDVLKQMPSDEALFTLPAVHVIHAQTIAEYAPPDEISGDSIQPTHSVVSELITRWNGWSLTVNAPGRTDSKPPQASEASVMIQTRRPTAAEIAAGMRENFALPPLRFQRGYRFCLRRVDLAGNHDYDEEYKIDDPPFSTMDGFSNPLISLTNLSYLSQARNRAKLTHAPIAEPQSVCFVPSNDPLPPMLAFPKGRLDPIYKSPKAARSKRERVSTALISVSLKRCPGNDCPESQQPISLLPDPPPPASTGFIRFAYQREQVLFLLSDVLHEDGRPPVDCDAKAWLLAPPAPVESVLMTGRLDDHGPRQVVDIIRRHERYLDDRCNFMAADVYGNLNYFGDAEGDVVAFGIESDDCEVASSSRQVSKRVNLFHKWPRTRVVRLEVADLQAPANTTSARPPRRAGGGRHPH